MRYDEEFWIKVYTRDTPGWLATTWQARGLSLEISRHMPKETGELSLGRRGLKSIAALIRADWEEIEPFIMELIEDGRLEYDEQAQVVRDPQHPARQAAITAGAERTRRWRANRHGVTPGDGERHAASHGDVTERHELSPRDDQKRREEKREEEKEEIPPIPPEGVTAPKVDLRPGDVWEHYVAVRARHRPKMRKPDLDAKNRKRILALLADGWAVADIKLSCEGLFLSPHHLGQNDRDTEYLDIEYALRPENLEGFIARAQDAGPTPTGPPPSQVIGTMGAEAKAANAKNLQQTLDRLGMGDP